MSQCDRILEVLRDRQPHRMEEIHQRAGFMRLNSRISELRERGFTIVCDRFGGKYVYTLLGTPGEAVSAVTASPGVPDTSDPSEADGPGTPEQLTLEAVA